LRSRPENLVFAQITGVPSALAAHPASPDFDAILSDSAMVERVDPSLDIRLTPSCDVAGRGFAFPPRRIVETARGLAARGAQPIVGSICQADFTDTIAAIADDVAHTVYTACE
jgi:hypothetical protein